MSSELTLEKMKIDKRLETVEATVNSLDSSILEIKSILFGEKGEKGVVMKLKEMVDVAKNIEQIMLWIVKLICGSIILAALPSITSFINMITHVR